jgi:hypothetical protein
MKKMFDNCKPTGYPALVDAKSSTGFDSSNSLGGYKTADISNDSRFFCVQSSSLLFILDRVG